jgi:hypothetical protein
MGQQVNPAQLVQRAFNLRNDLRLNNWTTVNCANFRFKGANVTSEGSFFSADDPLEKLSVATFCGFAFLIKEKLDLGHVRDVILAFVVDDLNLISFSDNLRNLFESHVAALIRVVELSVLVPFDDSRFFHFVFPCFMSDLPFVKCVKVFAVYNQSPFFYSRL